MFKKKTNKTTQQLRLLSNTEALNGPAELQWRDTLASTHFCMYVTYFFSYTLFVLWDTLWSRITWKPVTDAIKRADTQLHAFNVPKAEFPWHRCKHLRRQVNWKVSLAFTAGSRAFIDGNVNDRRMNRTAVVCHNDLPFPTQSIPHCQHFPATVAADDNKRSAKLKLTCCLAANILSPLWNWFIS